MKPLESISNLTSSSRKVNVEATVDEVGQVRTVNLKSGAQAKTADVTISDGTGQIKLSLWDGQIAQVKKGSKVMVENGYISTYKGRNTLNVGKYGTLRIISY